MPCEATLKNQRPAAQSFGFFDPNQLFRRKSSMPQRDRSKQTNLCDAGVAMLRVAAWVISYLPPHPLEAARIVAILAGVSRRKKKREIQWGMGSVEWGMI